MTFNTANLGQQVTKKLTTARLFWQLAAAGPWMDFGNVTEYKDDPKIERVSHMQGKQGFWREDFSMVKQVASKKSFTLDEHFIGSLMLAYLSNQYPQLQQTLLTADSTEITADNSNITADGGNPENEEVAAQINPPLPGSTYYLGQQAVTITSIMDGNDHNLVLGKDYWLDAPSGMLTVLNGSAPVGPWNITFTCLIIDDNVFEAFSNLLALGNFKLVEYDQFVPTIPRAVETFSGQVYVTGWGENKTDAFHEFTVEVLHQNSLRMTRAD